MSKRKQRKFTHDERIEIIEQVESLVAEGMSKTAASEQCGVDITQINSWKRKYGLGETTISTAPRRSAPPPSSQDPKALAAMAFLEQAESAIRQARRMLK